MLTNLIQMNQFPVKPVLPILLQDKTTKKNIIWATGSYKELGTESLLDQSLYQPKLQLECEALMTLR